MANQEERLTTQVYRIVRQASHCCFNFSLLRIVSIVWISFEGVGLLESISKFDLLRRLVLDSKSGKQQQTPPFSARDSKVDFKDNMEFECWCSA